MHYGKKRKGLSLLEAVDSLTTLSEIDAYVIQESLEEVLQNRERLKEVFKVIHTYLLKFIEKGSDELRDPNVQRGIHSLMVFINEAAQKIDRSSEAVEGKVIESMSQVSEYQDLQQFYMNKIAARFPRALESSGVLLEGWTYSKEEDSQDVRRKVLRDLGDVRQDRAYELFFIRKEDGHPFFNHQLLEHLKLVGNFNPILRNAIGVDLFSHVQLIRDKNLQTGAKKILHAIEPYMDEYYKVGLRFKDKEFVGSINKALMALMLAANSRNLMQNTTGKSCLSYYNDFQLYFRKAFLCKEYKSYLLESKSQSNEIASILLNLCHNLSAAFFTRGESHIEMVAFIRLLIEKGEHEITTDAPTKSPVCMWNTLLDDDAGIRNVLKQYPSGPLMKAVHLFSEHLVEGFDPIAQNNLPFQLYTCIGDEMHVTCLHVPCPTRQMRIGKAEIVEEFYGFLYSLSAKGSQRHLLINLQDHTSWEEHARCVALEEIQLDEKLKKSCSVVTLPKDGDFYLQTGPYLELKVASEFIEQFKSQVIGDKGCGYFFSAPWNSVQSKEFIDQSMETIHVSFFGKKKHLEHKNRLDFIEIFFLFLILKMIETYNPDSISFTCKDGIDTGAVASAELFSFLKMMNGEESWNKEDKDSLLWMLYNPALTLRERAVDGARLDRMVSALLIVQGALEAHRNEVVSACCKLYTKNPFTLTKLH